VYRWRAIIFDLDDTLYPERDYVLSGFRAVASWAETRLAIPAAEGYEALARLFADGVRGNTFNAWLAIYDQPAGRVPELVAVYREHAPALRPFPGIPELLDALKPHCALGLLGDGYLDVQRKKLAALGLAHRFDAVVFTDEWGRDAWKPDTRAFLTIIERLGVPAAETVYVGDNHLKDFLGARRAGMGTICGRHPDGVYAHHAPPTAEHAADFVVDSVAALHAVLRCGRAPTGEDAPPLDTAATT